jgi:hypothetical protein
MTATRSGTSRPRLAARPAGEPTPGLAPTMRVAGIIEVEGLSPRPTSPTSGCRHHDTMTARRARSHDSKKIRAFEAAEEARGRTSLAPELADTRALEWRSEDVGKGAPGRRRHSSRVGAGHPACPRRAALTCSVRGGSMVREHHPPNRALVNTRIGRAPCAIASSAAPASTERRGSRPIRHETCSVLKSGKILMLHLGTNSRARKVKRILPSLLTKRPQANALKFTPRSAR